MSAAEDCRAGAGCGGRGAGGGGLAACRALQGPRQHCRGAGRFTDSCLALQHIGPQLTAQADAFCNGLDPASQKDPTVYSPRWLGPSVTICCLPHPK